MRISVITPSYNQGSFIEDAIRSVMDQGYADFEHIVVDNCSTDNTIQILQQFPHIKWISEKDSGQSNALNKGFGLATGEVLCWLNCDDFYLPNTFSKVEAVLQRENVDAVYSDLQFCDEKKNFGQYYVSNRTSKFLSLFHTYVSSETLFFRKAVIDPAMPVDETLHYCMDQDFVAGLLYRNFKLRYIKDCFSVFRWQGNNKSNHNDEVKLKRTKEGMKIFNKHIRFVQFNPEKGFHRTIYYRLQSLLRVYRNYLKLTS